MPPRNPSNLRDERTFRAYDPEDYLSLNQQRHWCLLGEITDIVPWPMRLCFHIRDMDDEQLIVSFYDNQRGATFANHPDLKPGNTVALLYPELHQFADGQTGFRIEDGDIQARSIKILPYSMDTILKANDLIWKNNGSSECYNCQKKDVELKRCARCQSIHYCGKDCQTADWKEHKKLCKAFVEVKWFTDKNWTSPAAQKFRF
ncbi:hypothetical protein BZA77DRAFT_295075 [Pyronema omphalodes]|nr:hypothetical protein BZA77DRAFT_295075 [Pyronema omphalodes]